MAIDRDAIIRSVMFGEGVKTWGSTTPGNRIWYDSTVTGPDHDPEGAKKLLAGLGFRDRNGDGVLEDPAGHPVRFTIETNGANQIRVQMTNFVRDDLARIGIQATAVPVDFKTLLAGVRESFDYDAVLLGLQTGVPPDPAMGQNVWRSSGATHFWAMRQPHPATAAEAEMDRLLTQNITATDSTARHRTWHDIQQITNDQAFLIWLPVIRLEVPIRNSFGNLEPSNLPHRILWNIDRVYSRTGGTRS